MDFTGLLIAAAVAGVAVWFAAFLIWMVSGIHNKDILPLPDESGVMDDLKKHALQPGFYMWPNCQDRSDMNSDAFKARWKAGPWGTLNIMGGQPNFARNLIGSLVLYFLIALGIGVALSMTRTSVDGTAAAIDCMQCQVFWPAVMLGCCAYCLAPICDAMFMGKHTRFILTSAGDGLAYALVTALILTGMWPG